jgi:hypothetical protein
MARADDRYEERPPLSVLDERDSDPLLERLIAVHGAARFDVAPELAATCQGRLPKARAAAHN